ncbi:MAG: cytochrome b [Caldimonas sp.]
MTNTTARYDPRTIVLHWLTAALVVCLWLLGQTIDWFPKGEWRVAARSTHITLGVLLAGVLTVRIWWRSGNASVHLDPASAAWLDRLASWAHKLLYLLLVATVSLGVANAWIRGDDIFGLFRIPAFDPGNKALRETVEEWHGLAANTLLIVAMLHATAALVHHFILKDEVLRRMLPRG